MFLYIKYEFEFHMKQKDKKLIEHCNGFFTQ